jgi:SAM-dependent methyltransferase
MSYWDDPEQVERFAGRAPDHRLLALADTYADPGATTVLDLGCAGGRNTVLLAERGFDVFAVDSAHAMVARTRSLVAAVLGEAESRRRVVVGAMESLDAFADQFFDLIVALGVYHNATTARIWHGALGETVRVLKPGGLLLVSNFSPRTRPKGIVLDAVPGERHLYSGFPASPVYLVEAGGLDADMKARGLTPRSETTTVEVESEWGKRVSVNGLYVKATTRAGTPKR